MTGINILKRRVAASWRRWVVLLSALLVAGAGGAWLYRQFTHVFVNDAWVAADMVSISSRIAGRVTKVEVIDGDRIDKDQLLIAIDNRENRLRVEEFDARLAGIAARRAELAARIEMAGRQSRSRTKAQQARVESARADLAAAIAQREYAGVENDRNEKLIKDGAVPRGQLDRSRSALEDARQKVRSARADLRTMQADLADTEAAGAEVGILERQLAELGPEEEQLRAERERALIDLRDRTIRMPFDGVADRVFVHTGEYVTPGQRLVLTHDPRQVRIEAKVRETDIRHFAPGKRVEVTVDALPGRTFTGVVDRVGHAATSEFALLPNPNPSGNFTKITQRLPVRIRIARQDGLLKPGMMAELEADARE